MKRSEWLVTYTAGEVATAAQERRAHHEARLKHWTEQRTERENALREKGIVIDERPDPIYSNTRAGGPRYDPLLYERFQEAERKVDEHAQKAKTFAAWERMLVIAQERNQTIPLDVEDVEFFAL